MPVMHAYPAPKLLKQSAVAKHLCAPQVTESGITTHLGTNLLPGGSVHPEQSALLEQPLPHSPLPEQKPLPSTVSRQIQFALLWQ